MLRNREIRRFLILLLILYIPVTTLCFLISPLAGVTVGTVLILFIVLMLIFTRHRYNQIKKLSEYLKNINSGNYMLDVRDNLEGELSILKSELYKVTVMLREQNEVLKKDRAALADALSDISHQLKTPLTSMFMMTDLLCDADLPEEKRREFTSHIRSQLRRLQWLVSSLLKLSRLDAKTIQFKPGLVETSRLVEKAVSPLLIPMELKNQTLNVQSEGCFLRCDENWTAEALLNILKNCVEHTPENGEIAVICTVNPLYHEICIHDNGPGIDENDLPYIFNRFYRGKNASDDSVGIGLAMAAAIIQEQGGNIVASSKPQGSVFTIRFPK